MRRDYTVAEYLERHRAAAGRPARRWPSPPTSSWGSRARRTRTSRPRCACSSAPASSRAFSFVFSARPHTARRPAPRLRAGVGGGPPGGGPGAARAAAGRAAPDRRRAPGRRAGPGGRGAGRGALRRAEERRGRTPENRVVHLAASEAGRAGGVAGPSPDHPRRAELALRRLRSERAASPSTGASPGASPPAPCHPRGRGLASVARWQSSRASGGPRPASTIPSCHGREHGHRRRGDRRGLLALAGRGGPGRRPLGADRRPDQPAGPRGGARHRRPPHGHRGRRHRRVTGPWSTAAR